MMDDEIEAEIGCLRKRTAEFARLLWEALAYGEQCAHTAYAEWKDKSIDTETFNHIVRHRARRYLQQRGPVLAGWALDTRVTNNGINAIADGCQSKLFKAVHGTGRNGKSVQIPAIARSRANRGFVSQAVQPPLFPGLSAFEDALASVDENLLWLWDHNERFHIDHVWLVKPRAYAKARVIAKFQVQIENPLKAASLPSVPKVQEVLDDLDEEFQLPVQQESETGTEE